MTKIETRVLTYSTKFVENNENNTTCIRCKVLKDPLHIFIDHKDQIVSSVVKGLNAQFSEVNIGYKPWGFELIILSDERLSLSAINAAGKFIEKEFGKAAAKFVDGTCNDVVIRCGADSDQASLFVVNCE